MECVHTAILDGLPSLRQSRSSQPLSPLPSFTFDLDGREMETTATNSMALKFSMRALKGKYTAYALTSNGRSRYRLGKLLDKPGPGESCTFAYVCEGLPLKHCQFEIFDFSGNPITQTRWRSQSSSSGLRNTAGVCGFGIPLEQIKTAQVTLD